MSDLRRGLTTLVALTAVVVQVAVFDEIRPFGLRIDLPLLLVLGVGLTGSRADAAVVGWATGLAVDLHQLGPLGLTALVYAVAGWSLADSRRRAVEPGPAFRTVQGVVGAVTINWVLWAGSVLLGGGQGRSGWSLLGRSIEVAVVGAIGVHPAVAVGRRLRRARPLTSAARSHRRRSRSA